MLTNTTSEEFHVRSFPKQSSVTNTPFLSNHSLALENAFVVARLLLPLSFSPLVSFPLVAKATISFVN
jgi:hypothetical protein